MARSSPWQFRLPTQIQFGRGGLAKLAEMAGRFGTTAMLVGYRDPAGLEQTYARAAEILRKGNLSVAEFFEVPPDPGAELAEQGAGRASEIGADVIVAVGGGSVIDAAKGIAALAKMGGSIWDYTGANPNSRPVTESLPLVAVPTTAGTGTEVTGVAVFTHRGVASQPGVELKASIGSPAIPPEIALVDPDLTVGSPPSLTAACGADALGHAVEACISRRANPISSMLGGRAVALIVENLAGAVNDPDDPGPREPIALAATLAGAAFSQAGVVVTHALAQALGGVLHVAHGPAVAVGTPLSLRYNADVCVEQYSELAGWCGIGGHSPQEKATRFVDRIVELLQSVGLPDHVDVPPDAPDELIDVLVQNAIASTPVPITLNPRKVETAALEEMFREMLRFPAG